MSYSPAISVLVVTYNHAPYLEQALASIRAQTEQDLEVLIADDGSTDATREVARRAAADDPRIVVLTHPAAANRGIVETYQLAIRAARGQMVAFLEGDDQWSPDFLRRKREILDAHPDVGIVFSPYTILSEDGAGRELTWRQRYLALFMPSGRPFDNFGALLHSNNVATFSSFAVRREELQALPVPRDREILNYDWWVLVLLGARGRFYRDEQSTVRWRQHRQSALRRERQQRKIALDERFRAELMEVLPGWLEESGAGSEQAERLAARLSRLQAARMRHEEQLRRARRAHAERLARHGSAVAAVATFKAEPTLPNARRILRHNRLLGLRECLLFVAAPYLGLLWCMLGRSPESRPDK